MNPQEGEVLGRIASLLRAAGIPHMLCGSIASIAYSQPRATFDIDFVIDPEPAQLESFLASLEADKYYVSPEAAREARVQRSMFNIIELSTGWKIDLMFLKARAFDIEEFGRRVDREVIGQPVSVITAEDSILSKLEWRKDSQSERQYEDAVRVATFQWAQLDFEYLRRWATRLGISEDWTACSGMQIKCAQGDPDHPFCHASIFRGG